MEYEITGTVMPSLELFLEENEAVYSEKGGMAWMTSNMEMETSSRGGLMKGLARSLAGESFFLNTYKSSSGKGAITFTPEAPGVILPISLKQDESIICQRDSFMVAQDSVSLEVHVRRKLGSGFFGGEGFILQKLTGPGLAFVEITGEVRSYSLSAGQTLKIDPGHIAMYEPTVSYDISRIRGVQNMFFGGEGLFLATLTGPGRIWLQTMTLVNLAGKLARYMPKPSS